MRRNRVKVEGAYYHVMSRCALQAHLLKEEGEEVKAMFLKMLRRAEAFSGVKVINYCVMDNHFHLLLHVPKRKDVPDGELDRRIRILYGERRAAQIQGRWSQMQETPGREDDVQRERDAMRRRMYDLSEFMKTFKQRFSLWYCKNHGNLEGSIWQGVFHSVLVEGKRDALAAISAYITLNPVRAGMVEDAGDYAWSGYGAACAGDAPAKRALLSTYTGNAAPSEKWKAYRSMLAAKTTHAATAETSGGGSPAAAPEAAEGLHQRDKAMARGLAVGSRGFVMAAIMKFCIGARPQTVPRSIGAGTLKTPLFCAGRRVAQ